MEAVPPEPVCAWVGLGANLGDTPATLAAAVQALSALPGTQLIAKSSWYRSAPIEASGPDYLNAVAQLLTTLAPHELLLHLQAIEAQHGRERPWRNAARTLDLDLLLYGQQLIDTPTLAVPHPRMHQRAFVLQPLAECWPDGVVPGRGRVRELLDTVAGQHVEKLA